MEISKLIDSYLGSLISTISNLNRNEINKFSELILDAYDNGRQIFIFGNGGSASTASHFACDLSKGVSYGRTKWIKAIALTDNIPTMTAYSNDVSYDDIFSEQLKNFLNSGDLVIAISGSGNSKNILKAVEYANSRNNVTVGLTGYGGGKLKQLVKYSVNANINNMEISEDIHLILCHIVKTVMLMTLSSES